MSTRFAAGTMRIVVTAALAALAGLSFAPAFGGLGPALLLATAVPATVTVAWALWAQRVRAKRGVVPVVVVLAGVLATVGAVAVVTRPGSAVLSGPYRLLTTALPVSPSGPELAAVAALTGFAALVGCYLALTTRAVLLPALPPALCMLAGLGLDATIGTPPVWYAPAFVALIALLLLAGPTAQPGGALGVRVRPIAAVVVLAAGILAPLVLADAAPGAGTREPADLRSLVAAPVRPKTNVNPFATYLALRNGELPLHISVTASTAIDELRMATLTEFDGQHWSVAGDYRRAGHQLPLAQVPGTTHRVTAEVEVDPPDRLGWLPTAGRATEISVADLGVAEDTGDVVVPAGGTAPGSYRVTGVVSEPANVELLGDAPARAASAFDLSVPSDIKGFARNAVQGHTGFGALRALRDALKSEFGEDRGTDAVGGHSLYRISKLLEDKQGTSEQYASAFAVMCRDLGWDARVVLGFRVDNRQRTISGRDVHAWAEVRFNRHGWVRVDPTPAKASPDSDDGPPPPPHDDPFDSLPDPQRPPPVQHTDPGTTVSTSDPTGGLPWWATTMIAVGALAALTAAIPAIKVIRRARRRRAGTPRDRTIAAWHDLLDALRDTGRRSSPAATTDDVIASWEPQCPKAMRTLARSTDFAAFAPDEPSERDAVTAWADSDNVRKTVRGRLGFPSRVRATINPGSLLARRRTATPIVHRTKTTTTRALYHTGS
jgi:hypothetical protein